MGPGIRDDQHVARDKGPQTWNRTMTLLRCITCVAILLLSALPALAAKRVALVIGNAAYKNASVLDNPVNDANGISSALKQHGFEVIKGLDLDHAGMLATIRKFSKALSQGDVGVFYYAGHGIQISGKNYLVPTDAKLTDSFGIDFELVRLERIHRAMEQSAKVNILFLDACRNNPIARNLARTMGTRSSSIGNGLAVMESGIGSLISFSTQPGNVAQDGRGQHNSPYSAALVKHITTGNGDITEILIKVRRDVMRATGQSQVPWEHSALTEQFYFAKPKAETSRPTTGKPSAGGDTKSMTLGERAELAFWNSVKDTNTPDLLNAYLEQYPNGAFAPLARLKIAQAAAPLSTDRTQSAVSSLAALQPRTAARKTLSRNTSETSAGTTASREAPATAVSRKSVHEVLQRSLKDIGCYRGPIDGAWGPKSQAGLASAYKRGGEPSLEDMRQITAIDGRAVQSYLKGFPAGHCKPPVVEAAKPASSPAKSARKPKAKRKASTEKAAPKARTSSNRRSNARARRKAQRERIKRRRTARRQRARKKKNCRVTINPESYSDEKAPKVIEICD